LTKVNPQTPIGGLKNFSFTSKLRSTELISCSFLS
jgi:hypothetical protein